jgi:hypothetical protein
VKVAVAVISAWEVMFPPPKRALPALAVIIVPPQAKPVGVTKPLLLTVATSGTAFLEQSLPFVKEKNITNLSFYH